MRSARVAIAFVAVLAFVAACGGGEPPAAPVGSEVSIEVALAPNSPQTVRLNGTERGSGATGIVLAHMLGSSQSAWQVLVGELTNRGYHVLTFDFRGHGISGGDRSPSRADMDLLAAVSKLRSLGVSKLFVIGASMGGTAAVKVAAQEKLEGVVVISAPASIDDLQATGDSARFDEPSLFIVGANDDKRYTTAAAAFVAAGPKSARLQVIEGSGAHGTDLLSDSKTRSRVTKLIVDFLEANKA